MEPKPNSTTSGNPKNDLSEDDLALKRQIEQCVENLQDADFTIRTVAICSMWLEIRTSTSSIISVSKPLKFLRPHYETMKSHYELMPESDLKKLLADILSVLAWTISAEADRESLKYRFLGSKDYIGSWGHEYVRQEIRTSTSSMTSVPKPLKFLRPHYGTLKSFYESMPESDLKKLLADILSVLALTMSADGEPESLKYRMLGSKGDIGSWGHEYVRNLAGEIAQDYAKRVNEEAKVADIIELAEQIVAFHMKHNAEPEAVDLLMEVEDLDLLVKHVDKTNFKRTCLYLTSSARYLPGPDDLAVLDIAYQIYTKFEDYPHALQIALYLDNMQHVKHILTNCSDLLGKKQLCYILARQGVSFELDEEVCADDDDREALQEIINNTKLSEGYLTLARDIELLLELLKYPMKAEILLKDLKMTELFDLPLKHENKANFKKNMSVPKKFSKVNYRLLHPRHNRRRHDKSYSLLM